MHVCAISNPSRRTRLRRPEPSSTSCADQTILAAYANRDHDNVMFVDALRQQLDGYDHILATLGFLGTSVVHTEKQGTNYRPDSAVAEELRDLIDQLYTNIVTHAETGQ